MGFNFMSLSLKRKIYSAVIGINAVGLLWLLYLFSLKLPIGFETTIFGIQLKWIIWIIVIFNMKLFYDIVRGKPL